MRVVAVVARYPPDSLVGAWLTTHELLRGLEARGHIVTVARRAGVTRRPYEIDAITVHTGGTAVRTLTATADVVIAHTPDRCVIATAPVVRLGHGRFTRSDVDGAGLLVCNSESMRAAVGWDGPTVVVHPPVHPACYRTTPGDLVTLVNLSEAKGGRLFWQLARRHPHRRFLGVLGGYGVQVRERGRVNVDVIRTTPSIRDDVYARTRVLLMPSDRETWGRTALEAACSGIPTIAHPTPGLVEALGPAGIFVDRADLAGWCTALERLDDPHEWCAASVAARARADAFDPAADVARFAAAIEAL